MARILTAVKPYAREVTLAKFPFLDAIQKRSKSDLLALHGTRETMQIIVDTIDVLQGHLEAQRRRGAARSFLYDHNWHLSLAGAVRQETELLDSLYAEQLLLAA